MSTYEIPTGTVDVMDVEMPFLEAYRRGGSSELERVRQAAAAAGADALEVEVPAGSTGGSGSGVSNGEAAPDGGHGDPSAGLDQELDETAGTPAAAARSTGSGTHVPPGALQHTDAQEAVQNAAIQATGSSVGSAADDCGSNDILPRPAFRLGGAQRQPMMKALPDTVLQALRDQLRAAAVRELGVTDADAGEFVDRMGQTSLVLALVAAQLDLRLDVDAATLRAVSLFQSQDPLLGRVVARLDALERLEHQQATVLQQLAAQLEKVQQTSAVLEQALAYSIADRTENLARGLIGAGDVPLLHRSALAVRDKAREDTRRQLRLEREREGRRIR